MGMGVRCEKGHLGWELLHPRILHGVGFVMRANGCILGLVDFGGGEGLGAMGNGGYSDLTDLGCG